MALSYVRMEADTTNPLSHGISFPQITHPLHMVTSWNLTYVFRQIICGPPLTLWLLINFVSSFTSSYHFHCEETLLKLLFVYWLSLNFLVQLLLELGDPWTIPTNSTYQTVQWSSADSVCLVMRLGRSGQQLLLIILVFSDLRDSMILSICRAVVVYSLKYMLW